MNVSSLIDEPADTIGEPIGFEAGDLVVMPVYHGEHKFLVLGGQIKKYAKSKWNDHSDDVVIIGFEPDYKETFMNVHYIEPYKIKKVGKI